MSEVKEKTEVKAHQWTDGGTRVLILKAVDKNGVAAHGDFKWPESGPVECQDWNPEPVCGGGLHGWPWGMGIGEGRAYDLIEDKWIVYAADPADVVGEIDKGEKCKSRKAEVIYFGAFSAAWAMINSGRHRLIEEMAKASGYASRLAASGYATSLAASGNASSLAASGYASSLAASGYASRLAASGYASSLAASGYASRLAASGYASSLAASGNASRLDMAGENSTSACSGINSRVRGVAGCSFALAWLDGKITRYACGVVGEDGIEAGAWYEAKAGKIVKCD